MLTPVAVLAAVSFLAADASLPLARDGKSAYTIVLPDQATAVEKTAAGELQSHLRAVTGATLPIRGETEVRGDAKAIFIGATARLKQILPRLDVQSLGYDGIVIHSAGDQLLLTGRPAHGVLYAVYTFLEDTVGCRWWTAEESFMPKRATLEVGPLDVCYASPLRYREVFYRGAFDGAFAARLRLDGHHHRIAPESGGAQRFAGFVHTFYPLLPPAEYFAPHPEWYAQVKGRRTADHAQLCLTNEEMRRELVRNARELLRRQPEAGLISISQNDWQGRCECKACKAIEEQEGSPAGLLIRFVNAVAADLEEEFPRVLVETLAYQYTRQPPKFVRPRRNVVVRLCSIECSFAEPLSGPQNEPFRSDIEGWSRIAPQLFVWDYVTNFSDYLSPHPNLRALAPNVRFFADHKVIGLFEQGDAGSTVGDFVRLRAWLLAHLLWNPRQDEQTLVREFLAGYYGAAAPHLQRYLDAMQDAAARSGIYLKCFMSDTGGWLGLDELNRATRLFDAAARAVAGDAVLSARVRRERLPLDHVWLERYYALSRSARLQRKEFLGPKDPSAAAEEFIRLCNAYKSPQYREGKPLAEYAESLPRRFREPAALPAPWKNLKDDDYLDFQDNQFRLHKPGQCAAIVRDPSASDGYAARMPGDHFEWAVSLPLSNDIAYGNPWHCYVAVRCEAKASSGPALTLGIYDTAAKKSVANRKLSVEETAGTAYHYVDLGVHALKPEMYVWVAPPKRPGEVTAVYVDRVLLIREKR